MRVNEYRKYLFKDINMYHLWNIYKLYEILLSRSEVGPHKFIFLCSNKLIKEALTKVEFADRPQLELLHFLTDGIEAGM